MVLAILISACLVLAGALVALALGLRQTRAGLAAELAALRAELEKLEARRSVPSPGLGTAGAASSTSDDHEYVITRLGEPGERAAEPAPPSLEGRLFADIVLRESVVKAASFAYGVRRGLSPANRNRIWFEMRREVRRARKDRKAEEREAIREWRARQRAAVRDRSREDDAA
jgi:hypothetical protein